MSIEDNIKARQIAETIMDLVKSETLSLGLETNTRVYVELRRLIDEILPEKPELCPDLMSDEESRQFGRSAMPFGAHAGKPVDEVPLDYLEWLSDDPDNFHVRLRRYLKSRRVVAEMEDFE